jgi:hypothetical protein
VGLILTASATFANEMVSAEYSSINRRAFQTSAGSAPLGWVPLVVFAGLINGMISAPLAGRCPFLANCSPDLGVIPTSQYFVRRNSRNGNGKTWQAMPQLGGWLTQGKKGTTTMKEERKTK